MSHFNCVYMQQIVWQNVFIQTLVDIGLY